MISNYTTTIKACDTLQVVFEGSIEVKLTKRQHKDIVFDGIRMIDDETI